MKEKSSPEDDIKRRIAQAWRNAEPGSELDEVRQRWKDFRFVVKRDGEWLLEGFVNLFQYIHEVARAVDPTIPPQLPPHCFDVENLACFFRLPRDAFAGYRQQRRGVRVRASGPPRPPGRPRKLQWIADFIHERRERLTMTEIYKEFRQAHPDENGDDDRLRKLYQRYYGRS